MRDPSSSWLGNLWRRTTLVQRLTCLAAAPATVIALLLVTLLTRHQLESLNELGQRSAQAIATQTAAMAAEPLRAGVSGKNEKLLEPLAAREGVADGVLAAAGSDDEDVHAAMVYQGAGASS